ncbi:MAG: hypothetical protein IH892_16165 [Planctomycetes bacterium]|nr:hypothetical protein [Planctomycetota bacterium]
MRDHEREKVAKAFESILLVRLLEQMRNSVGKWGFEEDAASEQVQGIFLDAPGRGTGRSGRHWIMEEHL